MKFACALITVIAFFNYNAISQPITNQNNIKLFFEKVYVQTDRNNYGTSEEVWFKAYLINAQDGHLATTSKNLYVELIAPADTISLRENIHADNGTGTGDFKLPDLLPTGQYRLRAYTNWMRNFGDNFIFEKPINVISQQQANQIVAAGLSATDEATSNNSTDQYKPVLHLFPEGGSLIEGVSANVGVKVESFSGRSMPVGKGFVLSSPGDTVARFNSDTLGLGMFTLIPIHGQTYKTVITIGNQFISQTLTAPLPDGLALKIYRKDTSTLAIVSCNPATAQQFAEQTLTLTLKHEGKTYSKQQFKLNGNSAEVPLFTGQLPEGIIAVTVYDNNAKPNCERLIYNAPAGQAKVLVKLNKSTYQSREKVKADVYTLNAQNQPVSANLSLAATDAAVAGSDESNIQAYFLLQSDLKGHIDHSARYFDTTNVNRFKQLDLLLLTQGWRDFVWRRLADTAIKISYIPEQGISLAGRVRKVSTDEPVAGANITLSAPKAVGTKLFFTQTDASGKYYFDNLQLYGEQNIRLSSKDIKGKNDGWIHLDSLIDQALPVNRSSHWVNAPSLTSATTNTAFVKRVLQSRQKGLTDTVINLKQVKISSGKNLQLRDQVAVGFGYPPEVLTVTPQDYHYKTLRDYILYASKQARTDVASNRIVFYAEGKSFTPRIIVNNKEAPFTEADPDDVLDHYYNNYYDLPIDQVEKVEIRRMISSAQLVQPQLNTSTTNAYGVGVSAMSTVRPLQPIFIIFLTLKPGALKSRELDIAQANLKGYYEARTFYEPAYPQANNNSKPDNRITIAWKPDIKTDNTGHVSVSFFNADPKTTVKLIIQGVSSTGEPLFQTSSYMVK